MFAGPSQQVEGHPALDAPPPSPPAKRTLMDAPSSGMGADSGNPQIMALQGMQMTERGLQLITQAIPSLQDALGQVVAFVRQAVPQAMTGGNPMQVPATQPSVGAAPPMPPPQMATPQPGGPPQ